MVGSAFNRVRDESPIVFRHHCVGVRGPTWPYATPWLAWVRPAGRVLGTTSVQYLALSPHTEGACGQVSLSHHASDAVLSLRSRLTIIGRRFLAPARRPCVSLAFAHTITRWGSPHELFPVVVLLSLPTTPPLPPPPDTIFSPILDPLSPNRTTTIPFLGFTVLPRKDPLGTKLGLVTINYQSCCPPLKALPSVEALLYRNSRVHTPHSNNTPAVSGGRASRCRPPALVPPKT